MIIRDVKSFISKELLNDSQAVVKIDILIKNSHTNDNWIYWGNNSTKATHKANELMDTKCPLKGMSTAYVCFYNDSEDIVFYTTKKEAEEKNHFIHKHAKNGCNQYLNGSIFCRRVKLGLDGKKFSRFDEIAPFSVGFVICISTNKPLCLEETSSNQEVSNGNKEQMESFLTLLSSRIELELTLESILMWHNIKHI